MIDRRALLLGSLATLAACGGRRGAVPAPPPDLDAPYTLAPGDKLRVTVFGEPTLTGEHTITGAGNISFPLIGNVPAQGMTVEQLQDELRKRLGAGYIEDPRVSAEILDYRPYFVLGEVSRPGQFPFAIGLTVDQAIATAGGFTYRANTRKVFIKRAMSSSEMLVDLRKYPSFPIRPGDTIRVGERFF